MSFLQWKQTQAYQLGLRLNTLQFTFLCKFQMIISLFSYPQNCFSPTQLKNILARVQSIEPNCSIQVEIHQYCSFSLSFLFHFHFMVKHFRGNCMNITNALQCQHGKMYVIDLYSSQWSPIFHIFNNIIVLCSIGHTLYRATYLISEDNLIIGHQFRILGISFDNLTWCWQRAL